MAKTDDAQQLQTEAEVQKGETRGKGKRAIKDVEGAEQPAAKRGRGRPAKGTRKTVPYVPTGKPRGRPKLPDHLKKTKVYVPNGGQRGRPANSVKKLRGFALTKARAEEAKGTPKKSK
jgi:hypothetical protein